MAKFIPGIYNNFYYKILGYFWGITISLPRLEKYRILNLPVVGRGGPLMLVCSNARITGGFSIFGNTFNAAFWGFP